MRFGSLFSGIGGLDLGLERAGMECAWQVEIEPYCLKVLEKHWPNVPKFGDVHDCGRHNLEPVDLICGGFPCQPVSLAGKRLAQADKRWLWPEFARIIRELRPRYALVENVPGLLSAGFGDILGDLASLGYDAEWQSIPASAVGAPHLRYRVFILAYPRMQMAEPIGHGYGGRQIEIFPDQVGVNAFGEVGASGTDVSDTEHDGCHEMEQPIAGGTETEGSAGSTLNGSLSDGGGWWSIESSVGRVAHGIPSRVDRLKGLGNAVVPQVAEWIGRRILQCP